MSEHGGYGDQPLLAEFYDLVPMYQNRKDVEFYVDLCKCASQALEVGCGTGRIAIPAALAGVEITGLDLSEHMLARFKRSLATHGAEVRDRIELVCADMTEFDLGKQFPLIIVPFRAFQHLRKIEDQLACLACLEKHLAPCGRLVIDFFQVDFGMISGAAIKEEIEDTPEFELPDGRRFRRCFRILKKHRAEQFNDVEIIYYITDRDGQRERHVQAFPFRYFFRYEVEHLFARAGFEIVDIFGDFDRSPLEDSSPEMIFVGTK